MTNVDPTTRAALAFFAFIFAGYLGFGAGAAAAQYDDGEARRLGRSAGVLAIVGLGLMCSAVQW